MHRLIRFVVVVAIVGGVVAWLLYHRHVAENASVTGGQTGGRLVALFRTEPNNFNRYVSPQAAEGLLALLTQAPLVRVNRLTGAVEPWLAREWVISPDGRTWTISLRNGVEFSDGTPFTAADVVFSFQAAYDSRVKSPLASALQVAGHPFMARAADDLTVVITCPEPAGPGIAMLDSLPILPRHKLAAALAAGTFDTAWAVTTPLSEVVGLGPFVLSEYVPGQRLRFTRNPHYWRRDDHGVALPYLDEIELQIVPEQNAEILRLTSGQADLMTDVDQVPPEDMRSVKEAETRGVLRVVDAGATLDPSMLWFNLAANSPRAKGRPWLQREELRRAISYAVDRHAVVDTVFLGAAEPLFGPVTSGYGEWYVPDLPKTEFDPAKAKSLLASIGLLDRNGDGILDDPAGHEVRIAVLTQKGNTLRERTVAVLKEQLSKIGLAIDIVALDTKALIGQYLSGDYDAMYFGTQTDSADPARNPDFWLSSGAFHFWNPSQPTPATPWEAQLDALMKTQETTVDPVRRHELVAEAQRVFADHLPAIYFAAQRVTIAISRRVEGATPVVLKPHVLWNADTLRVSSSLPRR